MLDGFQSQEGDYEQAGKNRDAEDDYNIFQIVLLDV